MKLLKHKLFYYKGILLKKTLLLIPLLCCLLNLNAQVKSSIKLGIEAGIVDLSESNSLGLLLHVEPKIKSSQNTVIGLRIGAVLNSQTIENKDSLQYYIDDEADNGTLSFVPTFEYNWNENKYRPYLGIGIGYHVLGNPIEVSKTTTHKDIFELSVKNQFGLLLRAGLEPKKLRLGLEYSFIPKADIVIPNTQTIGTVDISYLGLSVGFTIGD